MKYIILFGIVIAVIVAFLFSRFPDAASTPQDIASLIQLSLIGLMLCSSVLYLYRQKPSKALQHGVIWLALAFICFVGYSFKDALLPSLIPGYTAQKEGGTLAIRAAADGHFYMQTEVNGEAVRFMVDTGASNISLPIQTAERLGINTKELAFTQAVSTANGQTFAAPITLHTFRIGNQIFNDVPASVNQGALSTPLLGIRFLSNARNIEIREDELIITF